MSWEHLPKGLENSPSLQGQAGDFSREDCSDSELSATLNSTPIASKSLKQGLQMAICGMRRYGVILRPLTGVPGLDRWILSLRDSHASRSPSQESKKEKMTHATCGRTPFASLEKSNPNGVSLKMSQRYLPGLMDTSDEYCVTFPRAGIMCDGIAYPLPPLAPRTKGTDSGLLVGTPTASMTERSEKFAEGRLPTPKEMAKHWRTPSASDGEGGIMEMREGKCGHYKLRDHVQEKNKHMWPTPAAQEPGWKNIEVVDKDGNTPEHPAQRFYHKETGRLVQKGLAQVAAMWPTPRNCSLMAATINESRAAHRFSNLETVIARRMFPTPNTVSGHQSGRMDEWGGKHNPLRGTPQAQGALNPDWVEWLMNWPIGWTDLVPLVDISAWEENIQSQWDYDPADYGCIPRITTKKKDRVNRLKAVGNGQVPLCAAIAFLLLQGDLL